jgi:sugar lactone lactonase YvrE
MSPAAPLTEPCFTLAEGPVWDGVRRRLLWVDILGHRVLVGRLGEGAIEVETEHRFESYVGAVALAPDGALLVAEQRRLTRLTPDGDRASTGPLPGVGPDERFNDGTCDARGRLLIGTMSLRGAHHSQRLLQLGPEGTRVLDDDLGLSNGLAFSPDEATLYSVDSVPGTVWRRSYDQETGASGARSVLLDLSDCTPDGLTVDAEGHLWVAVWGHGEVRRYTPDGVLVATVAVPAPHTSSVTFAGESLDELVITTARSELTTQQLDEFPLSGSLFRADPQCTGIAPFLWSGLLPPDLPLTTHTPQERR